MIRPIVLWPDPILAQKCAPVTEIDDAIRVLCNDMLETMYAAPGRGLAAPQVGVLSRVFVMDTTGDETDRTPRVFINPKITNCSETRAIGPEGCLSIPGVTADIERAEAITLSWTALDGGHFFDHLTGFEAVCAQHEFDHLEGLVTFDHLAPDARKSLEAEFLK